MSVFNDRVRDSDAVSNLRQAASTLHELKSRNWEHQATVDLVIRLNAVGANLLSRLTPATRNLVASQILEDLGDPSQRFLDVIEGIAAAALDEELDPTLGGDSVNELLTIGAALPVPPIRTTNEVIENAAEQFDREVQSSTALFKENIETIHSQVTDINNQLQKASTNNDTLVAQLQETADERIAEAANTATLVLEDAKATTDSLLVQAKETTDSLLVRTEETTEQLEREITSIQETFRNSEKRRDTEFTESQKLYNDKYREEIDDTLGEIVSLRDQAKSMLEEVAGASTAAHYTKQRDEQNAAADRWRRVGMVAFVGLIIAAGYLYYDSRSAGMDLTIASLAGRSTVVLALLGFVTYALRQSGHHRQREEDISRVSNELILLGPFMNRLPVEDRQALLREITPLYFKGGLTSHDAGDKVGWMDSTVDRLTRRKRTQSDI